MDGTAAVRKVDLSDVLALTKPGLTRMVVLTAGMGVFLAPESPGFLVILAAVVGTALVVASANTFNCVMERDSDALMERTRDRPLPAGRLEPEVAIVLGLLFAAVGFPILLAGAGPVPTLLAAVAHLSYVLVYTPLKQRTPLATLVGAVPGAIPPVIGWSAATGEVGFEGLALFGLLFVWQLPHFFAISLFRREEYGRAGIKVHPLVHGDAATRRQMLAYAAILVPTSLLVVPLGLAGWTYAVVATLVGVFYFLLIARGVSGPSTDVAWARRVFRGSLIHLVALMALLMLDGLSG